MSEGCSQQSLLEKIDGKIDQIVERLSEGDTKLALLGVRLVQVEEKTSGVIKVLSWAGTIIVGAVLVAILKTVIVQG